MENQGSENNAVLLWLQLLNSSWANQMFSSHPPEGIHSADIGNVSCDMRYLRINQIQLEDNVGALHEKISLLLSMLSSWIKTRLASTPRENLGPKAEYICLDRDKPRILATRKYLRVVMAPRVILDVSLNLCSSQFQNWRKEDYSVSKRSSDLFKAFWL